MFWNGLRGLLAYAVLIHFYWFRLLVLVSKNGSMKNCVAGTCCRLRNYGKILMYTTLYIRLYGSTPGDSHNFIIRVSGNRTKAHKNGPCANIRWQNKILDSGTKLQYLKTDHDPTVGESNTHIATVRRARTKYYWTSSTRQHVIRRQYENQRQGTR